jgi:hypothetical protein
MRADGRVATAALMLALFGTMSARAATFPFEAGFVPLVVGVPAMLLCAYVVWAESARVRRGGEPSEKATKPERPRDLRERPARFADEVALIAWLWGFAAAIIAAGFLVGGTLATLAFVRFRLREPLSVTLGAGAVSFFTLYLVFEKMLGLVLFQGLVAGG